MGVLLNCDMLAYNCVETSVKVAPFLPEILFLRLTLMSAWSEADVMAHIPFLVLSSFPVSINEPSDW